MTERLLTMPRLGETMDEGKIVGWLIKPGDAFRRGDPIIEIETDKTIAEFPALGNGKLGEILVSIGDVIAVGAPIARIDIGEEPDWTAGEGAATDAVVVPVAASQAILPSGVVVAGADGPVRATPPARLLARNHGLDIRTLRGTGRRGRIEKHDVLAVLARVSDTLPMSEAPADVRFADLASGRMAYLDTGATGNGTVLLLHGFAGDRTTWAALAAGLRRAGRRVVVPDLPGHGLTEIEAASAGDLSADLPAFLDRVAPGETVDVVAHSLGAVAALDLALSAKARVGTLTLIAPAGLGTEIDTGFLHGMAQAAGGGEIAHLLRRLSVGRAEMSEAALAALGAEMARRRLVSLAETVAGPAGQRIDSLAKLERLAGALPIRIVFGLEDRIVPWRQVAGVPPRVAIHLLARSGHMPQWDQTRDVLDILLS